MMEKHFENDWLYLAVVLGKFSKRLLYNKFGKYIPEGWQGYCHHMTICFNKHDETSQQFYEAYKDRIGEKNSLFVVGFGKSDKAMAVKVEPMLKINNKTPHITIAVSPTGKPVESNYITNWEMLDMPLLVNGTIEMIKKK